MLIEPLKPQPNEKLYPNQVTLLIFSSTHVKPPTPGKTLTKRQFVGYQKDTSICHFYNY